MSALLACLLGVLGVLLAAPTTGHAASDLCHRVRPGETLVDVARRHRVTVARLRTLNRIEKSQPLRTGTVLILSGLRRLSGHEPFLGARALTAPAGNLRRENVVTDRERLSRIRDNDMLRRFVNRRLLVPLQRETQTFVIDGVPPRFRVTRPWTRRFIIQLAAGYHALFGARLRITSLARTIQSQRRLRLTNDNAAPSTRSSHLTGAAVDIGTGDVSGTGRAWLRHVLRSLAARNVVLAIEELRYPHFHVVVRRAYFAYARTIPEPRLIGAC